MDAPFQQAFSDVFGRQDRLRGSHYFHSDQVRITTLTANTTRASVHGSGNNLYEVILAWEKTERDHYLLMACECPRHNQNAIPCKHLWATLLTLEELRPDWIEADGEILVESWAYEDLDDELTNHGVPSAHSAEVKSSWRDQIQGICDESRWQKRVATKTQRELWYCINVNDCLDANQFEVQLLSKASHSDQSMLKPVKLNGYDIERTYSSEDVNAFQMLLEAQPEPLPRYDRFRDYSRHSNLRLNRNAVMHVLGVLAGSNRLLWRFDSQIPIADARPVELDRRPWKLALRADRDDAAEAWKVTGHLILQNAEQHEVDSATESPFEQMDVHRNVVMQVGHVVLLQDGRLVGFDHRGETRWIELFRRCSELKIPFAEQAEFLAHLFELRYQPVLEFPDELRNLVQETTPEPVMRLTPHPINPSLWIAHLLARYGEKEVDLTSAEASCFCSETQVLWKRDHHVEQQLLQAATAAGIRGLASWPATDITLAQSELVAATRALMNDGWVVYVENKKLTQSTATRSSVTSGIDWFDLDVEFDFGESQVKLPELLKAARKNQEWIELSDGTRGLIPERWLQRYEKGLSLGEANDGAVRFRKSQALLLDAMLSTQPDVDVDADFRKLRTRLSNIHGVRSKREPATFRGELRDYQRGGLGWMKFLQDNSFGGCLADDMGLGKTVQILALLEHRRKQKLRDDDIPKTSLIVVPRSLIENWIAEAQRFTPNLQAAAYYGMEREQLRDEFADYDFLVTTYSTMRNDIEFLAEQQFDYVILDEAQAIKNAESLTSKACRLLRANHRVAASGTPIENHLGELWSLFEFLNPGLLGRSKTFRASIRHADENPEQLQLLAKAVAPYILRRTKQQVLTELPEKSEQTLYCDLPAKQRKQYDELKQHFQQQLSATIREKGLKNSKIHILEALLRLRQAACHPGLVDKTRVGESSAKVDLLLEQLQGLVESGHKVLVFSQFTSLLQIVKERLDSVGIIYEWLDGKTRNRQARVVKFQSDPDSQVFLISLKAGGTGLNLTAADYVFILDPWWNPAVESQAIDRSHRIGQTQPVTAYRIIARDTIEEKVAALQSKKKKLAEAIITANDHILKSMTMDDLTLLLG